MGEELPVSDAYLGRVAREVTDDESLIEDLVQEGRITTWVMSRKYPGKPRGFYGKCARRRMMDLAYYGYPMTGESDGVPRKGRKNPLRDSHYLMGAPLGPDGVTLADVLPAPDSMESCELAYHRREIHSAIRKLTPKQREYVVNRFWLGESVGNLGASRWSDPPNGARDKLRVTLAHLADVA